jgi:uncharacterized protein (DUF58 family)
MYLTRRAILLLLIAAPLIAASSLLPVLRLVTGIYLLACVALFVLEVRLSRSRQRLDVSRSHAQKLNLGIENTITLRVFNHSLRPVTFWLRDEPPDEFVAPELIHQGTVQARQEWQACYLVTPLRRGNYRFGNLTLRWQGLLGLLVLQKNYPAAASVKVYPNLLSVQRYELLLRRNQLQEIGLRLARQRGEGTDYERLREYLPDDDFRRIDWKATARRNRPITVEYETERSQNVFLVIDTGRMMQSPVERIAKLDYVINASLLLTYVATRKRDKVGLMTFADRIDTFLSPGQGMGQFYKALELLYAIRPQPVEPDYNFALNYLALKQRRRSLVVIFTDISSGPSMDMLASHAALLQRSNLVLVVTISDPDVLSASLHRPANSQDVYQRAAALQLLEDRRLKLDRLRKKGALVLDVPANQLSNQVINRYLDLKAQTRL